MPLTLEDCKLIKEAIVLLKTKEKKENDEVAKVLSKVEGRLRSILNFV